MKRKTFKIIICKIFIILCFTVLNIYNDTQAISLPSQQSNKRPDILLHHYINHKSLINAETGSELEPPKASIKDDDVLKEDHTQTTSSNNNNDNDLNSVFLDEIKNIQIENKLSNDKRLFVIELFKMLHEQYGTNNKPQKTTIKEDRIQLPSSGTTTLAAQQRGPIMNQLLNALNADGDISRLIDWIQNSFNLASVGELTTQFVVGKLASVNCAALLKPDNEETLIPRFLLFNEHFVDVPFEMQLKPTTTECLSHGRFDPLRKTVLLLHGYLGGYTIVDGLTNIKNRILDLNKFVNERAMKELKETSSSYDQQQNNSSSSNYVLTEDIDVKIRIQKYNVIIVDWFNGANPIVRSRYIRSAVNAQVVGDLIARFIGSLITQCKTPANRVQIMAHSLGKLSFLFHCYHFSTY